MLGGNIEILEDLEALISKYYSKERAITCSSGYLAGMSSL
jgi:7-keto-8-aminopelargonate synthetase-like enzyme